MTTRHRQPHEKLDDRASCRRYENDPIFEDECTNGTHLTRITVTDDGMPLLAVECENGPLRQVCQAYDRESLLWLRDAITTALSVIDAQAPKLPRGRPGNPIPLHRMTTDRQERGHR